MDLTTLVARWQSLRDELNRLINQLMFHVCAERPYVRGCSMGLETLFSLHEETERELRALEAKLGLKLNQEPDAITLFAATSAR